MGLVTRAGPRLGRILAASTALVLLIAGACSGRGDVSDGGRRGTVADGGLVALGLPGPIQPDPVLASLASPSDLMVLDLLHDGLTRSDDDGNVVPELATGWTSDGSLRVWTFALDPAATFTNGRPVNAQAVVASLEHLAAAGEGSIAALQLEVVAGFRAFLDGTSPHIDGLRAADTRTVEVTLDAPMESLPALLASPSYGVVDLATVGGSGLDGLSSLVLSGRWQVTATRPDRLTLSRRDGARGQLATVELSVFGDSSAAYAAFERRDVDWAPVPGEEFGSAVRAYGDDAFAPFHAELLLGLRTTGAALGHAELRQAIAAAIDRDAIVRAVYPEVADPLIGVVPAGVPGHREIPCAGCTHDPAKARSLVAAAFPDGQIPGVAIDVEDSPAQLAMAAIVAQGLKEVGIPTEVRRRSLEDHERFVVTGGQELFTFGWIGAYVGPGAYLTPLFASASPDNLVGSRDGELDALLAQAEAATPQAAALGSWAAVEERVLQAAVVVPIAQFRTQVVVSSRVKGLVHAVDGTVDWSTVEVDDPS